MKDISWGKSGREVMQVMDATAEGAGAAGANGVR